MIEYRIDMDDRIVDVNDEWTRFASANGAQHLTASSVMGRHLWQLIPAAQALYAPLLYAARGEHRAIRVHFRCDSPDRRRLMEMHITPMPELGIRFCTREIAGQQRQAVTLLGSSGTDEDGVIRMCSWCKRVAAGVAWYEVEEALACLGLLERARLPLVSHGICAECASTLLGAPDTAAPSWPGLP